MREVEGRRAATHSQIYREPQPQYERPSRHSGVAYEYSHISTTVVEVDVDVVACSHDTVSVQKQQTEYYH